MSAKVKSLNHGNFATEIKGGVALVDFWAPWCGPCRMQAPILERLAENVDHGVTVGKVDVDQEPELAMQYGVQSIPTLLVLKNGQPKRRLVGLQSEAILKNALAEAVNS